MSFELKEKETLASLNSRIEAHKKHADKDITDWMVKLVNPQPKDKILDVGCGNGNLAIKYATMGAGVVGIDISEELIKEATQKSVDNGFGNTTYFYVHDMNEPLNSFPHNFDKISSCFSIYYAKDMKATISNLKAMLKPNGKLFIVAPTEHNAINFMQMHWAVNRLEEDQMAIKRTYRARDEVIPTLKELFNNVQIHRFKNRLVFDNIYDFMDYYCATPLFRDSVSGNPKKEIEYIINVENYIKRQIKAREEYSIYKESYGIIAGD